MKYLLAEPRNVLRGIPIESALQSREQAGLTARDMPANYVVGRWARGAASV
ncbi:MAG TPA: hypothetical protein VFP70_15300 [Burkholderiales bacterium]|nr:hypothetical protein [Burkholderiales bacterium]